MEWIRRIAADEPARLRAAVTAIIAVAAGIGVAIPAEWSGWAETGIAVFAALLPILQGETTRAKVTPVAKLERQKRKAAADEWLDTPVEDELQ